MPYADPAAEFRAAVHAGLICPRKTLPCRYFYDHEGSLLFEAICDLPEYYLTRTEDRILQAQADNIAACLPAGVEVMELGCGSARKTRRVLEALLRRQRTLRYLPVDISAEMLGETAAALTRDFPALVVEPIIAEYGAAMQGLHERFGGPKLVLFLGSNLGNFDQDEGVAFLRGIRGMMRSGDHALLGLDLVKERETLEAAYDDSAGVTARFNLNLLARINRDLGADFDLASFAHRALFNAELGRVEMHLVSTRAQAATLDGVTYRFAPGETIHTENSYKYTPEKTGRMVGAAGLAVVRTWTDPEGWFSVNLLA